MIQYPAVDLVWLSSDSMQMSRSKSGEEHIKYRIPLGRLVSTSHASESLGRLVKTQIVGPCPKFLAHQAS